MTKSILISCILASMLISQGVSAYDPEGFHECMLDNIGKGRTAEGVLAIRLSCAYLYETDGQGERNPFPAGEIAEDSFFNKIKELPEFSFMNNSALINHMRDNYYPDSSYEQVKEWLTRSTTEHGDPPEPPTLN